MPSMHHRCAPPLLALAMLLSFATSSHAGEDVVDTLDSMPGMQLIAAVDAMHVGDLTKADALFTLALEKGRLAPEGMVHAWFNRGLVRQRMGRHRLAVADFTKALGSDVLSARGRAEALYNRGLSWRKLGALQKAMNDFSLAIELYPRFAAPYYSRALGLAANGHYLLALVDLEKALKHGYGQRHKLFYSKAMIHLARGERKLAIKALRTALKHSPNYRPARQRLAALQNERKMAHVASLLPQEEREAALQPRSRGLTRLAEAEIEEAMPVTQASTRLAGLTTTDLPVRPTTPGKEHTRKRQEPRPRFRPRRQATSQTRNNSAASRKTAMAMGGGSRGLAGAAAETGMMIPAVGTTHGRLASLITSSITPVAKAEQGKAFIRKDEARIRSGRPQAGVASGGWAIQLASSPSKRDMQWRWKALRRQVSELMPSARARIMRANLSGRGVYYRLRLVGFASRSEAGRNCLQLKQSGISCLVVKAR